MTTDASMADRLYTYAFWQLLVEKTVRVLTVVFRLHWGYLSMPRKENDQNIIPLAFVRS
jgi:hypothetical protein